jgi:hypothetical protein
LHQAQPHQPLGADADIDSASISISNSEDGQGAETDPAGGEVDPLFLPGQPSDGDIDASLSPESSSTSNSSLGGVSVDSDVFDAAMQHHNPGLFPLQPVPGQALVGGAPNTTITGIEGKQPGKDGARIRPKDAAAQALPEDQETLEDLKQMLFDTLMNKCRNGLTHSAVEEILDSWAHNRSVSSVCQLACTLPECLHARVSLHKLCMLQCAMHFNKHTCMCMY